MTLFFKKWANTGIYLFIFCPFLIIIQIWIKKHRCFAWGSNPGPQDGRRRRIHWANDTVDTSKLLNQCHWQWCTFWFTVWQDFFKLNCQSVKKVGSFTKMCLFHESTKPILAHFQFSLFPFILMFESKNGAKWKFSFRGSTTN